MSQIPPPNLEPGLCILRDVADTPNPRWRVFLCRGYPNSQELGSLPTRAAAAHLLFQEQNRLEREGQPVHTIHLPDDCPCYRK